MNAASPTTMTDVGSIERVVAHRPWPMPRAPWIMLQSWTRQLFAHWPVTPAQIEPLIPEPLVLDTFGGNAYVGLTPFHLGLRLRWLPGVPGASNFPEMNLRTYVRYRDRPGVFFFSLDAASALAVVAARATFRLPYFRAEMSIAASGDWVEYRSRRLSGSPVAEMRGRYRPVGEVFEARHGSLDHFLTERYALYVVVGGGTVLRGDIHHEPWQLQPAEATLERNTVADAHRIQLPPIPPILHYSRRQDTLIWAPVIAR